MRDRGDGSHNGADGDVQNVLQLFEFEAAALHSASQESSLKGVINDSDAIHLVRDHRMTCCGIGTASRHSLQHAHNHGYVNNSNYNGGNDISCSLNMDNRLRLSYSGDDVRAVRGSISRVSFTHDRTFNKDDRMLPDRSLSRERDAGCADSQMRSESGSRSRSRSGSGLRQSTDRLPSRERDAGYVDSQMRSESGSGRRNDSSSAPSPTDDTEDIQERYLALLRQMKGQSNNGTQGHNHRPVAGSVTAAAQRRQQGRRSSISPSGSGSVRTSARDSMGRTSLTVQTDQVTGGGQERRGSISPRGSGSVRTSARDSMGRTSMTVQTHTQTHTQTDRHTNTQTHRQSHRQIGTQTDTQTDRHTDRSSDRRRTRKKILYQS